MPAKAGIQTWPRVARLWIPAFAGMSASVRARRPRCGNQQLESRVRENRQHGSEGGEAKVFPTPITTLKDLILNDAPHPGARLRLRLVELFRAFPQAEASPDRSGGGFLPRHLGVGGDLSRRIRDDGASREFQPDGGDRRPWVGAGGNFAFYVWDYGVKNGDIRLLGVAAYAAPVLSTLILVAAGFAPATPSLGLACALIVGGAAAPSRARKS